MISNVAKQEILEAKFVIFNCVEVKGGGRGGASLPF